MTQITTEQAMEHLTKVLSTDPEYAYGWHANIAMMCYDSILGNEAVDKIKMDGDSKHYEALNIGNDAASRFMKLCFKVETSQDMLTSELPTGEKNDSAED